MTPDKMTLEKMTFFQRAIDKMTFDKVPVKNTGQLKNVAKDNIQV
jgi:hypothetical protein